MSKDTKKAAPEEREYALVIVKRGGGLSVIECEVPRGAMHEATAHPPDAADQALGRIAQLIERRFLR